MKVMIILSVFLLTVPIQAKSLGTMGQTWPVIETDFLTFFKTKAQQWWLTHGKQFRASALKAIRHHLNKQASGLTMTDRPKTFFIDPSKGSINPFHLITYSKGLIFLDGSDQRQLHWLKEWLTTTQKQTVIILTGGSVEKAKQCLQRKIFLDQHHLFTDTFKLKHVPVLVEEDRIKKQWRVQEINRNEVIA